MKPTERLDIEAAAQNARTYPRPPGSPPSYLRCDWCEGDWTTRETKKRCTQAEGHSGEHTYTD